ncbi:hypothetical protein CPS_2357 [Colwellia psychrerythraea 34H]|uniref:Uncharacterized protein n=1 Tax=Colwellia psychrerythraea (strain 34H / ATCC BAA-681) TaxID=167879 RepID=Q482E3_COLP3|nr:hypothetical protein CPS_2357 [Colwellia psychrerythraea 34H]
MNNIRFATNKYDHFVRKGEAMSELTDTSAT